jgi:mono/diheme cytochrome c family protein
MMVELGGKSRRHGLMRLVLGATFVLTALAAGAIAQEKETPVAPGVDYWQPDWMVRELWGPGRMPRGMMVRLLRQTTFMKYGVPEAYQGKRSTVVKAPETITAGRKIFMQNCAVCHGRNGLGNGEAANALSPSPALLAYMIRRPIAVDEYLLWTISDGGAQFGSKMPPFKGKLASDDIWRVVAFMRAGFPAEKVPANAKPEPKR